MSGAKDRKEPAAMAADMANHVNRFHYDDDIKSFVKAMRYEHRTLQQNFTRLCVAWLEDLGKREDNNFDLRNGASVELGRAFLELPIERRRLPYV